MDDNIINFDQLQDEINEAERYLREEVLRTKAQGYGRSFRTSKEQFVMGTVQSDIVASERVDTLGANANATTTPKKYSNPESREKLLSRLLVEHGSKQSTPTSIKSSKSSHTFGSSDNMSNHDEFGGARLGSSQSSRYNSPSPSQSSRLHGTPPSHQDSGGGSSVDTHGGYYGVDGSDGGGVVHRPDDTLFFASDVVSPDLRRNQGIDEYKHVLLNHSDFDGKTLSTMYTGDSEGGVGLFASHFLHPASPPRSVPQKRRGKSVSPPRTGSSHEAFASTTRRPTSAAPARQRSEQNADGAASQKKFLKSKEEVIASAETDFKQRHTFRPKLEAARSSSQKRGQQVGSVQRIDSMIQVHGQALANRERQKIELERAIVEQNCSFKPQLSRGTQQINKQKARQSGTEHLRPPAASAAPATAASERLYRQAGRHQVQQRMLKHQLDEARNAECTFRPTVNPASTILIGEGIEQRPLYERVGEVQRQQAMSRQVLMECYEEADNEHLTRNPEINAKSRRLVEKTRQRDDSLNHSHSSSVDAPPSSGDVGSRLMNEARAQLNRKYRLVEERERELASQVRDPGLCKGSQRYVANNPNISNSSFIKRQEDHSKKVTDNISESRRRDDFESNQWFKPGINPKTNDILSQCRPEIIQETPEQRALRLYRDDAEEIDRKRRQIEQEMYGNISFVPDIDPISRELGRSTGVKELSENKRGQRLKNKSKQMREQRESEECTFQPQISQSKKSYLRELYSSGKAHTGPNLFAPHMAWEDVGCPATRRDDSVQSSESGMPSGSINLREPERMARDIRLRLQEKEERRRAELMVREIDELQECSFQPKIYRTSIKKNTPGRPVVVAGVGRHLELQQMKQRQDAEARRRADEAFRVKNVDNFRSKVDGATIVEPFRIAQSSRGKSRAAAELEQSESSNLTFHPVTNDFERRLAAKQVMQRTLSY